MFSNENVRFCITDFEWIDFGEHFLFQLGCNLSNVSNDIYVRRHSRERKIALTIVGVGAGLALLSYVPSTLCWMSTIVFGVPSSRHWAIPLSFDKVWVAKKDNSNSKIRKKILNSSAGKRIQLNWKWILFSTQNTIWCVHTSSIWPGIGCRNFGVRTFYHDINWMHDLLRGHLYVFLIVHRGFDSDHCMRQRPNWTTQII